MGPSELTGKIVEVVTVETLYVGRLVQVSAEEVQLESETGWIIVPTERVILIREAEGE
jgi:hypothetical protein